MRKMLSAILALGLMLPLLFVGASGATTSIPSDTIVPEGTKVFGTGTTCRYVHFQYTDGHKDQFVVCGSLATNDLFPNMSGSGLPLHVNKLHISCSDAFTGSRYPPVGTWKGGFDKGDPVGSGWGEDKLPAAHTVGHHPQFPTHHFVKQWQINFFTNYGVRNASDPKKNELLTKTCGRVEIPGDPKLEIEKTAVKSPITVGEKAAFDITVKSTGSTTAKNVKINDPLPATGSPWVVVSENGASPPLPAKCTITSGNQLVCGVGDLAVNATFTVRVQQQYALASESTLCGPPGGKLPNTATAVADGGLEVKASAEVTVECPGLKIVKTAAKSPITVGEKAKFTITVTDTGETPAQNVKITDDLPVAGAPWVVLSENGVSPPSKCTITDGYKLVCAVGDLAKGAHFTVTVEQKDAIPVGSTLCGPPSPQLPNTAKATADGVNEVKDDANVAVVCASLLVRKDYSGPAPALVANKAQFAMSPVSPTTIPPAGTAIPLKWDTPADLYCLDGLPMNGKYTVTETTVPSGYQKPADQTVTVSNNQTCQARKDAYVSGHEDLKFVNLPSPVDLTVKKLKLSFVSGLGFVQTNTPLEGFKFTLYKGSDAQGQLVAFSTTAAGGETSFAPGILEVGTQYAVCETAVPAFQEGWWTEADPKCQTFTPTLNAPVTLTFRNAPKAKVTVGFQDLTQYASAEITCKNKTGTTAFEKTVKLDATGTLDLGILDLGDYTCDIQIRNGGK
jgi:uncharacterized repeat protein (TIGR01451 family)